MLQNTRLNIHRNSEYVYKIIKYNHLASFPGISIVKFFDSITKSPGPIFHAQL